MALHFPGISISDPGIDAGFEVEKVVIKPGGNLASVLSSRNIDNTESMEAINALKKVYDVDSIPANHNVNLVLGDESARLLSLSFIAPNKKQVYLYKDQDGKFQAKISDNAPYQRRVVKISSVIKTSLFSAVAEKGVPQSTVMNLISIYDDVINLKKNVRAQDQVEIVFERFFDQNGNFVKDGKILYAALHSPNSGTASLEVYRHVFRNGDEGYFDVHGKDIRSSALSKPVSNNVRVSSKFGWRTHPILGYSHFHRGIDFAVSYGTPVYSAGDGVVEFVGSRGGYGKYIKIKHNGEYASVYGHLSRFAKNLKAKSKVKRGQLIAYSGSSGLATGPHLHYEVLFRSKPINPSGVLRGAQSRELGKDELVRFKKNVKQLDSITKGITYANAEETEQ